MKNNTDKLTRVSWEENNPSLFQQHKYTRYLRSVHTHVYRPIHVFINNINTNTKSYYVSYQYYTVYILFLYDSNELHRGYLPCCYEDVEALCIWDGDIEILLQRGGVLVGRESPAEVLYTWDGDVEILYRGVGFWLGRDSPAAIRMQRCIVHGMEMDGFIEGQGFGWGGTHLLL